MVALVGYRFMDVSMTLFRGLQTFNQNISEADP